MSQAQDLSPAGATGDGRRLAQAAWAIVIAGAALRLAAYLWNTGFWYDEGWLIQNLQDKSYLGLAGPLENDQSAPLLYLWLLKAIYGAAGLNELALRAPAILPAVAGMLLMLPLARRLAGAQAMLWVLALLAVSDNLLIFSARTKPYALDALATTLLLYAAIRLKEASPARYFLVLAAMEAALFWLSYPSCFAYGGAVIAALGRMLRSRRGRDWAVFIAANLAVGATVFVLMRLSGAAQKNEFLEQYWGIRGFPMGWSGKAILKWPFDATYRVFQEGVRPIGVMVMLLSLAGIGLLWRDRQRRFQLGLLCLPLLLGIVAACLRKYPWVGGRLSLWTVPIIALLAGIGLAEILRRVPAGWPRRAALATGAVILAVPAALAVYNEAFVGHRTAHGRPLAEYVLANARPGDHVAILGSNEFGIYLRKRCPVPVTGGEYGDMGAPGVLTRADWKRCWLLVRAAKEQFRAQREDFLRLCPVLEKRTAPGAELYLLLPPSPRPATSVASVP